MLEAPGELAIWRHQLIGERNPLSDNALGQDMAGRAWKTRDYLIYVNVQGDDGRGRLVVFTDIEPVAGDLIIRLAGRPATVEAALEAPRAAYYTVRDYEVRRSPGGQIIYARLHCEPDRSGRWQDYRYTGTI